MAAANDYPANGDVPYSTGTPPKQSQIGSAAHQRTYQACIPCRQRKVRCDLGSVDNPHDPPCSRCKRESKECYFSATRRKKKSAAGDAADSDAGEDDIYEIKNGRKRLRASAAQDVEERVEEAAVERPRTPGGSVGRSRPLRRPAAGNSVHFGEEDEKASEQTTAILQSAEVHGGHDALKVLYQAALGRERAHSQTSVGPRPIVNGAASGSLPPATSPIMEKARSTSYNNGPMGMFQSDRIWKIPTGSVDPKAGLADAVNVDPVAYSDAVKAWSRFRFVRAGWFTAKEGIEYILYFYKYLAPLTPAALPDFRSPSSHKRLLEQEAMLAVTMLLIASRHMPLEGPGSNSRPYAIHQKLWTYLSGMIDRVVWGQEQFGGGFCGAGAQPGCDVNPLTRKGLRTLGSVESLVLLTEWHPRAMHFPPNEDDNELMLPDELLGTPEMADASDVSKGIGGQRMDAWLEPCWRSDRMCWMLLGMAMALAFEIGVFDLSEWQRHANSVDGLPLSADDLAAYEQRRVNVKDLLLVYVTQTSGRLGLTSMLPGNYSKPEDSELFSRELGKQNSMQEVTLHFWLRIAALMREGNRTIFANKNFTRDLIRNGNYKAALEKLHIPLSSWRRDFDDVVSIPKYMRCILEIEYEYCRVYLNALGLQAVAERCVNDHPSPAATIDPPLEMARTVVTANGSRPEVAISPTTLAKWLGGDRHYMVTVGEAARKLLKIVVDDLYPDGYLRHAPVRTYFRIISVAIMLLKTFALGATESAVTDSLTLMDRTVEALRTCIVDDVHVASRFADLLDVLTQNLKPRLVRINADGRSSHRATRRFNQQEAHHSAATHAQLASPKQQTHTQQQPNFQGQVQSPQQNQWGYNSMFHPGSTPNSNPLFGISNDTYDLLGGDNQYSIMPPPGFNSNSPSSGTGNSIGGNSSTYDTWQTGNGFGVDNRQDWLALPLDPLLNISGADVNQTMYGPELGGTDMLELLLNPNNNF